MVRYKDSLLPYGSSESKGTLCRNLQRSLFVLFCEIFGVQGAGGVEYSNDHNAHIGKTVLYHDAQLDMICQNPPFLKEYTGDPELIAAAEAACAEAGVKALVGKIATGDLFVGDSETKAAIEAKCAPDCVEMEGAAVSQIAAKNGVPCVILRAMSDNADEDGHEVLVVKKFSISEYVATATKIVAAMVEKL